MQAVEAVEPPPADPNCNCPRCTAKREAQRDKASPEAGALADAAIPDTDIVVGRVDRDGKIHLISKGFTMKSFIIRCLIFVAGIIGGQIPGLWSAITDTVVRWRTELPSDASPLAKKTYAKLETAEGWELNNSKDNFMLSTRNTSLNFLPDGTVDVMIDSKPAANLTGAEARAIRTRGTKVRDSIVTMRQDALTKKLFREADDPPKSGAGTKQTVAKGE